MAVTPVPPPRLGRNLLVALLLVGILGGLAYGCWSGVTSLLQMRTPLTEAADGMLGALKTGDLSGAYDRLSRRFRDRLPRAEFDGLVRTSNLDKVASTSWSGFARNTKNGHGTGQLTGSAILATGTSMPLGLVFVYEDGAWKIDGIVTREGPWKGGEGLET